MTNDDKINIQNLSIQDDIAQLTITVFGNSVKAEQWLITPIKALNNKAPIEMLMTDEGVEEVRSVLNKIQYGEFT